MGHSFLFLLFVNVRANGVSPSGRGAPHSLGGHLVDPHPPTPPPAASTASRPEAGRRVLRYTCVSGAWQDWTECHGAATDGGSVPSAAGAGGLRAREARAGAALAPLDQWAPEARLPGPL